MSNKLNSLSEAELSDMVLKANFAYHSSGKPIMTDSEYDDLIDFIKSKFPNNKTVKEIGAPVAGKNKVTLPYNMPSMDKIKPDNMNILDNWTKKYRGSYVISCKLDGVSGMICGSKMYTRGDGTVGQDISHLIKPMNLPTLKDMVVRGEFIMKRATFDAKYKSHFSNPRNMVSGIINSKKADKTVLADLDFVAYEVVFPAIKPSEQMAALEKAGYNVVKYNALPAITSQLLINTVTDWRATYLYEIDGIIIADDGVYERTDKNPEHAFAFKMAISEQMAETRVLDVLWEASQDGYLKPRVKVEQVKIGGVNIEFTTGFNGKFIEDNKIGPGAVIQLIRSGDVIPYIKSVLIPAEKAKMPDVAFIWNPTKVDVILENAADDATVKEKNIVGFFTDLEVEGLSTGNARRIIAAKYDTIPKILKMTPKDFEKVEGFKDKMIEKVHGSIKEKVGSASLVQIMAASNKFGRGVGLRILTPLMESYPDFLTKVESRADKIAKLNASGIHKNAEAFCENIDAFLKFLDECDLKNKLNGEEKKTPIEKTYDLANPLYEKSVVMTKVRDQSIIDYLNSVNGTLEDSFKKNTVALIVKSKDDVSNKTKDAVKKGIPIMTVEEFKQKYM